MVLMCNGVDERGGPIQVSPVTGVTHKTLSTKTVTVEIWRFTDYAKQSPNIISNISCEWL
jgi:hypothetical protein